MERCVTPTTARGSNAGKKASEMPLSARVGKPDHLRFWIPESSSGLSTPRTWIVDSIAENRPEAPLVGRPRRWLDDQSSLDVFMRALLGPPCTQSVPPITHNASVHPAVCSDSPPDQSDVAQHREPADNGSPLERSAPSDTDEVGQ